MNQSSNNIKSGGRMQAKQSFYWIIYFLIMVGAVIAISVLG
jgi:hypothetical protein